MGNKQVNPQRYYLYPLRPLGQICVIDITEYSYLDVYGAIIVTGKDRGKHTFVRRRDIVLDKGRKPEVDDIKSGYNISELLPEMQLM